MEAMEVLDIVGLEDKWTGYDAAAHHARESAVYIEQRNSLSDLVHNTAGYGQRKWAYRMEEAMSTAEFPVLFGDIMDRELLASYKAIPPRLGVMGRTRPLSNFREVRRSLGDGIVQRLPKVAKQAEYPERRKDVRHFGYIPEKFGTRVPLDWESWLNDDLGFFEELPQEMAQAAFNTREYLISSLFWDSAGPKDTFFADNEHGQKGVSNLPLTIANLETAVAEMTGGTDGYRSTKGEPIMNQPKYLVVPPKLEFTARNILNSTAVQFALGTSTASPPRQPTSNVIAQMGIQIIVDPWMPIIVTTGNIAETMWALFSENIKPFEVGNIRGHETPEVFVKTSNAQRVGGGVTSPFDGDFEHDVIDYKVRYVQGQDTLDQRAGWASDGQ